MTLFELAQRFVGEVHERAVGDDPFIQWCHASCNLSPETPDEVPWCSSFLNRLAWILRLPRSKSAAARSWLAVGLAIELADARPGDVVVFSRGTNPASGHVALFAGRESLGFVVQVLGGNQSDGVTVASFPINTIIGIRRLTP